jgi:hypothetical protein
MATLLIILNIISFIVFERFCYQSKSKWTGTAALYIGIASLGLIIVLRTLNLLLDAYVFGLYGDWFIVILLVILGDWVILKIQNTNYDKWVKTYYQTRRIYTYFNLLRVLVLVIVSLNRGTVNIHIPQYIEGAGPQLQMLDRVSVSNNAYHNMFSQRHWKDENLVRIFVRYGPFDKEVFRTRRINGGIGTNITQDDIEHYNDSAYCYDLGLSVYKRHDSCFLKIPELNINRRLY